MCLRCLSSITHPETNMSHMIAGCIYDLHEATNQRTVATAGERAAGKRGAVGRVPTLGKRTGVAEKPGQW